MSRNKEHRGAAFGGAPNGAAANGGLCSVFLINSYHKYLLVYLICSLYIPHIYIYMIVFCRRHHVYGTCLQLETHIFTKDAQESGFIF